MILAPVNNNVGKVLLGLLAGKKGDNEREGKVKTCVPPKSHHFFFLEKEILTNAKEKVLERCTGALQTGYPILHYRGS